MKNKIYIILIIAVSVFVYANSIRNGFTFDDKFIIQKNELIRSLNNIPAIFRSSYWPKVQGEPNKGLYRPLAILTYALDYSIWKLNPAGYHIFNVLNHSLNGIVLFLIILLLQKGRENAELTALAAALIFICHPINTEAVSGLVGRADTLATLFILLSLLFYILMRRPVNQQVNKQVQQANKARQKAPHALSPFSREHWGAKSNIKYYYLSLVSFGLALFTKEIAVTLPGIILLYDISLSGKGGGTSAGKLKYYAGYLAVMAGYMIIRTNVIGLVGPSATGQVMQGHTILMKFYTMVKVFVEYIRLLFYPVNLYTDYNSSFAYALKLTDPGVIISVAALFLYVIIFFKSYKRSKLLFFSMGWFLIAILPVSQLIPIGAIMAERFLYLPGIGFCILLGTGMSQVHEKKGGKVFILLVVLTALFFSIMTIRRNLDWYSDYTLWKAAAKTVSTNARAYYEIGTAALKEDKYDEVIDAMKESIRLSGAITASDTKRYALLPESYLHWVWLNLGLAYQKKGETDNAIEAYKKVIEIKPDYVASYNNLGNAYLSKNMTEEALNMYKKSIEVDPNTAEGYYNLGILYSRKGDNNKALQLYSKAITIRPEYADVWFASGIVEYNRRDYARAAQLFKKAVEINPGFTAAKSNYEISLEMAQDKSSQ